MVSMSAAGSTLALGVDHAGVVVRADDVDDRVHLADVGQELVAQALAAVGARDEPGDVVEGDRVVDELGRAHGLGHARRAARPRTGTTATFGSIVVNG